jgi:alpha-maltose-1-phosphate synthase
MTAHYGGARRGSLAKKKPRILMVTRDFPPNLFGGPGVHVEFLTAALRKLFSVQVRAFSSEPRPSSGRLVKWFHVPDRGYAADSPRAELLNALRCCVDIVANDVDCDVVHCHTWYTYLAGVLARRLFGRPTVMTAHSLEVFRTWKRAGPDSAHAYACQLEQEGLQTADAIIAPSESMHRDLLSLLDLDPDRVHTIHNGVDARQYFPTKSNAILERYTIEPRRPYVLFLARLSRQKGITLFLKAAELLPPSLGIVMCTGYCSDHALEAEIARSVARLQAKRAIVWIRNQVHDHRSKRELYSHAAVFCSSSVYEPFGLTNLEAMACGTPVVATRVGGVPEVVIDGHTGILVDPCPANDAKGIIRTASQLADAIRSLVDDPALACRLGRNARRRAVTHFGWDVAARKTERVYRGLVR